MATELMYEIAQLSEAAGKMGATARSLQSVKSTLANICSQTDPVWNGDASSQFQSNHKKLNMMIQEYLDNLQLTKQTLEESIAVYQKVEGAVSGVVKKLDTKGIFD